MVDLATWRPTIIATETVSDGIDRGKSTYSLLNKLLVRNAIQHADITLKRLGCDREQEVQDRDFR